MNATAAKHTKKADTSSGFVNAVRMVWPLAAVLGVIIGLTYVSRRWLTKVNKIAPDGAIKMLARHYISGKQSLCLVRVGTRVVLLGVTPERINAIAEISDPQEAADVLATAHRGSKSAFAEALASFSKVDSDELRQASGNDLKNDGNPVGNVRRLAERLRALSNAKPSVEPT